MVTSFRSTTAMPMNMDHRQKPIAAIVYGVIKCHELGAKSVSQWSKCTIGSKSLSTASLNRVYHSQGWFSALCCTLGGVQHK